MNKIIITTIVFLAGFISFGFTADYVAGCVDGNITGGGVNYNCKFCNGEMYNFDKSEGILNFYNRCCEGEGDSYSELSGSSAGTGADECCEAGSSVEKHNNIYGCYEICNGERYDASDAGYDMQCCDGKKQFVTSSGPDNGYEICCSYGTAFTGGACVSCEILDPIPAGWQVNCDAQSSGCNPDNRYTGSNGVRLCCPGMMVNDDDGNPICIENNEGNMGINMSSECLINGQCSYNIYQTLGIRKSDQNPSVSTFVKDIVLAVTMFIGTVVSIVLIVSGILYIVSSIQGNSTSADMAKKGIINSIVGLLLVVSSYAIVRLIQFLATAGGG